MEESFDCQCLPQCAAGLGYVTGEFAPGIKEGTASFFISWTNMLKAHGYAVRAIREHAVQPVQIGMAPCGGVYYPVTDKEEDVEAARKAMFTPSGRDLREDLWNVAVWNDPVYLGRFPEEIEQSYGQYLPLLSPEDWEVITSKLDYIGYNIYNGVPVRAGEDQRTVCPARTGSVWTAGCMIRSVLISCNAICWNCGARRRVVSL